jgi:hypothetical protein
MQKLDIKVNTKKIIYGIFLDVSVLSFGLLEIHVPFHDPNRYAVRRDITLLVQSTIELYVTRLRQHLQTAIH